MTDRASVLAGTVNWGDAPSWLSASVSVAALIFAVLAVVVSRRTFRLESERDRINAEERRQQDAFVRRAQAALVSAWWAIANHQPDAGKPSSWGAYLRNASEAPVYKANLTIIGAGIRAARKAMEAAVVPPTRAPVFHPIEIPAPETQHTGYDHLSDYRVSMRFTDAAGVRWVRDEYGALRELQPNLLVWTSPEGGAVLAPFTEEFLAAYGVRTKLDTSLIEAELQQHFIDTQDRPDILVGPHDWVGSLAEKDLVSQITLSDQRSALFRQEHLDALSVNGRLYAVPSSLDTITLMRNTDLVPDCPETFEQLIEVGQYLRDKGLVSEVIAIPVDVAGDPYHVWPLFTSAGGWLFERTQSGMWNEARQGIDTAETIGAFEKIRVLGQLGILRPEVGRIESFEMFEKRRTAFILAGSGAVVRARQAGVNFAVSAVPPFAGGKPGAPFLTVNGFYVARDGQNRVVADDLVPDYLTRRDVIEAFGRSGHVVPPHVTAECDPAIHEFHRLCSDALPLPSFPQMREVWQLLGAAELALIAGEEAEEVAHPLAERLKPLF